MFFVSERAVGPVSSIRRICRAVACMLEQQERTEEILRDGGGRNHVMNLGHGIDAGTPEENAAFFVNTVKNFRF